MSLYKRRDNKLPQIFTDKNLNVIQYDILVLQVHL